MATMYFAQDGNYGDAEGIVLLDLDTLGFPVPNDLTDLVYEEDMPRFFQVLADNVNLVRVMRNLIDPDNGNPKVEFPEYLKGLVDTLHDVLGCDIETAEVILTTPSKVA